MKVVVTGAAGAVGRRVWGRLVEAGFAVVAVDGPQAAPAQGDGVAVEGDQARSVDLGHDDLEELCRGADALVHLARTCLPDAPSLEAGRPDLDAASRLLAAASACGVGHVVVLSSAMVYGAWPDNPVPLTEDAPVRPNPELPFALHLAELERRAMDWRGGRDGVTLTVMRPAVTVADGEPGAVARLLRSAAAIRTEEGDPPVQYLHVDDLADAVVLAVAERIDGVVNVAPDGWMPADTFHALLRGTPRPRLPMRLVERVIATRRWLGIGTAPPGLVPFTTHAWVVANDRLRARGWQPANTSEEAFVAGHHPGPLEGMNARRRQQVALSATGGLLGGAAAVVASLVLRSRRRSRRR